MKITFLGTGHGVPSAERATSSVMVSTGGKNYYIDAGAPIAERTLRLGERIEDAEAIFTTHAHGDHLAGLYLFLDLYNWRYKTESIKVFLTEDRIVNALTELISATVRELDTDRIKIEVVGPDFVYDDGNIRVTLYPTLHMQPVGRPSFGIMLEAEGKRVYFSGDLSQHLALGDFPAPALAGGVDLFVCELAHFGIEHIEGYLPTLEAKRVAFNHVYPLSKYEELRALQGKYHFELLLPSDMESIEI